MEQTIYLEIIRTASALLGAFSAILAFIIFRQQSKEKRVKDMFNLFSQIYNDNDFIKVLYYTDNNNNNGSIAHGGDLEKEADKSIKYLNYLGTLLQNRSIEMVDVLSYGYEFERIIKNEEVKEYIKWLKIYKVKLDGLDYFISILENK